MNAFSKIATLPRSVVSFTQEARQELKTVQWPSRRETVRYTVVILIVSAAVAVVTGVVDALLTLVVEKLLL